MKSVVKLTINVPQARLAELFANPAYSPQWMDDLARYEPISGQPGTPGSQYRLVPKKGSLIFVATVLARDPPVQSRVRLEAPTVAVAVTGTFEALSRDKTRMVSEEVFKFKGAASKVLGFVARRSIRAAHRRHMEAFKRFAEGREDG